MRRAQATRSLLVQVQSAQSYKQLFTYCESMGKVENMFHYCEGPEPLVIFNCHYRNLLINQLF